ncbi:MAG: hypothetical protein RL748_3763 [Pseudomonadota bacterium]
MGHYTVKIMWFCYIWQNLMVGMGWVFRKCDAGLIVFPNRLGEKLFHYPVALRGQTKDNSKHSSVITCHCYPTILNDIV